MVFYSITLVPLVEELRAVDPGLLSTFYADNVAFDGSAQRSAQLLNMLMKMGPDRGYLPDPAKSLFISNTPWQEEEARRDFLEEGLVLNFVGGSRYLGAYLCPQEELEAWVKPQVEAWAHRVRFLGKISQQHPQLSYAGLGMPLQLEWQYLQSNVPGVGNLMGPIEEALKKKFLPTIFGEEEINADFRKILGHSFKRGSLGIPDPRLSAESSYNTSKAASWELVYSLLGVSSLNYVGHRACVRREILAERR